MKTTDKYLIGIVVGIVLLIVVAFAVTLTRPEPTYQADDTPEGVAHNYLLALQKVDYERAYGYLSPKIEGYPPSAGEMAANILKNSSRFRLNQGVTISVESGQVTGSTAIVTVRENRFSGGNLFDSGQSTRNFTMDLHLVDGEWKIEYSYSYFALCWSREKGCD